MGQRTPWSLPCLPEPSEHAPARPGNTGHPAGSPPASFRGQTSSPTARPLQRGEGERRGGGDAGPRCTLPFPPLPAPPEAVRRTAAALAVPVSRPQRGRHPPRAPEAAGSGRDHRHVGACALVRSQFGGARLSDPLLARGPAGEPVGGEGRLRHGAPARPARAVAGHRLPRVRPGSQRRGPEPAWGTHSLQHQAARRRPLLPGSAPTRAAPPRAAAGLPQPRLGRRALALLPGPAGARGLSTEHWPCHLRAERRMQGSRFRDPSAQSVAPSWREGARLRHRWLSPRRFSAPGAPVLPSAATLFPEMRLFMPQGIALCGFIVLFVCLFCFPPDSAPQHPVE